VPLLLTRQLVQTALLPVLELLFPLGLLTDCNDVTMAQFIPNAVLFSDLHDNGAFYIQTFYGFTRQKSPLHAANGVVMQNSQKQEQLLFLFATYAENKNK
jgi:hypothetical protein